MLTEEQQQIVNSEARYIAAESCAGSGKTTVISWRIKHLLDSGVNPASILVCTFSRSQAEDMAIRILKVLRENGYPDIDRSPLVNGFGENSGTITTIHAATRRMLISSFKEYGSKQVAPIWRVRSTIEKIVESLGWTYRDHRDNKDKPVGWRGIAFWIAAAKNELIEWKRTPLLTFFEQNLTGTEAYNLTTVVLQYQQEFDRNNLWTFGDMLAIAEQKFRDDESFRTYWQLRFTHIIIDEAQDSNEQAMRIIKYINPHSLFVAGDSDQTLYAFLGATPEVNLRSGFDNTYHGSRYNMTTNFRSQPLVLLRADNLISYNYTVENEKYKKPLHARPNVQNGCDLTWAWYADPEAEAKAVVGDISDSIACGEVGYGDVFICGRLNAQLAPIEIELLNKHIPFVNLGTSSFFNQAVPKLVVDYMRMIICRTSPEIFETHEQRWESFRNVHNKASCNMQNGKGKYSPSRWLGEKFLEKMNVNAPDLIKEAIQHKQDLNQKGWAQWERGVRDIETTFRSLEGYTLQHSAGALISDLCELVITDWMIDEYGVETTESESAADDLAIVQSLAERFTVGEFLEYVRQLQVTKEVKPENLTEFVLIGTGYRLKGLERHTVYGIGFSERILPHRFSLGETPPNDGLYIPCKTGVTDERNLAFVMITRAKESCKLSGIEHWPTIKDPLTPSRFIYEMGLLEREI